MDARPGHDSSVTSVVIGASRFLDWKTEMLGPNIRSTVHRETLLFLLDIPIWIISVSLLDVKKILRESKLWKWKNEKKDDRENVHLANNSRSSNGYRDRRGQKHASNSLRLAEHPFSSCSSSFRAGNATSVPRREQQHLRSWKSDIELGSVMPSGTERSKEGGRERRARMSHS